MTTLTNFFKSLTVIETATILAGPSVGMFLAELGATVIKVENLTQGGDTTRSWRLPTESPENDVSAYFSAVNWGKQSIGLNLAHRDGQAVLCDLIKQADIFIHNFKDSTVKRLKIDYEALQADNPKLIHARVTAYGEADPRPGFDAILQAETGFTAINGSPESGSTKMPVALIDVLLAHQLKEAILLALMERNLTGQGQPITLSLFQSGVVSLANQATNYLVANTVPQRRGSDHPNISPYGTIFTTKDGREIVLAVGTDGQFRNLVKVLGRPALAEEPTFQTNTQRVEHNDALKAILSKLISQFSRDELLNQLHAAQVPVGAVRTLDELFQQPAAQELLMHRELPTHGPIRGLRTAAFSVKGLPKYDLAPPPHFDQHRDSVLQTYLNYPNAKIKQLQKNGVIS